MSFIAFEEIIGDKTIVKCKICSEASASGILCTIQKGSIAKHLESCAHAASIENLEERAIHTSEIDIDWHFILVVLFVIG